MMHYAYFYKVLIFIIFMCRHLIGISREMFYMYVNNSAKFVPLSIFLFTVINYTTSSQSKYLIWLNDLKVQLPSR